MSDHDELADQREEEADRLEHENERISEGAQAARDAQESAYSDSMVPEPMGEDDPAHRPEEAADSDESDEE